MGKLMWQFIDALPWWGKLAVVAYALVAFRIALCIVVVWFILAALLRRF